MKRINVTKTFLPPIEEYQEYVARIWASDQLTNQGPILNEFETKTCKYLGLENFQLVTNGTLALQLALRALDITDGEIITTPFSYVATTSAILWERCTPVYVDIEPDTFGIDVTKIEAAITPRTKAIMAVHVFGYPCDVEAIEKIAARHSLRVIYDAAHAFGVVYRGKSLLSYGDISTCSFHATKLFHTIEGGCIVASDHKLNAKIDLLKRFGHYGDDHFSLGMNAKASEFQAAMGLCNLKYVDEIIDKRHALSDLYDKLLEKKPRIIERDPTAKLNYGYFPLVLRDEAQLHAVVRALNAENIYPRRYFYPSLNTLPYVKNAESCPVSEQISGMILCLPLYADLELQSVTRICQIITSVI